MEKKKIIVLGAGFGGLKTALRVATDIRRLRLLESYEVVLIDGNEHHTFTPLLYETATTSREAADLCRLHSLVTHNISALVKNYPIIFIKDTVLELHPQEGTVILKEHGTLSATYLILALGSETNYFNIPGLKEHSLALKTFIDAIRIRDKILDLTAEKGGEINVAVGGAGPTGVELSAELGSWCCRAEYKMSPKLNVTLIEAQPTILFGFSPHIIGAVGKRLSSLGVTVKANTKISKITEHEAEFENGERMPFDIFIWTGGIKTPDILLNLPVKKDDCGKIQPNESMDCIPETPDLSLGMKIYGLGDSVCFHDPRTGRAIPSVAPAALAQASVVAHNIVEDIKEAEGMGKATHRTYRPIEYPYVVPVGGKYAVAKIGPFILRGFFGWITKGIIELHYLVSIMPGLRALRVWLSGLRVFIQNDQLG